MHAHHGYSGPSGVNDFMNAPPGRPQGFEGAGPNGFPFPPRPQQSTRPGSTGKLGKRFEVHVDTLLDMPRAYTIRRPKGYIVKALVGGEREVGKTKVIDGSQGFTGTNDEDFETIRDIGLNGIMEVEAASPLIHIQVEYSDGEFIGRCHIHRQDDRSRQIWPYQLSDPDGNSVNCGVQLRLVEYEPVPPAAPSTMQHAPPQTMHHGMPEQQAHHHQHQHHPHGPPHGPRQGPPQMPEKIHPPLFGPLPNLLEIIRPGLGAKPPEVPEVVAPAIHAQMAPAQPSYGMLQPTNVLAMSAPQVSSGTYTNTYSYTLPPAQHEVLALTQGYSQIPKQRYPTHPTLTGHNDLPNDLNDFSHPGSYLVGQDHGSANDGVTELWCAPPPASWQDGLFGSDQDLEVKAMYSEPWNRPLDACDRPLFVEEDHFEDMDISAIGRQQLRHKFTQADPKHSSERKKDGLPEFSFSKWVPAPKTSPKALPAPKAKAKAKPKAILDSSPKAPPPRIVHEEKERRAKGKVSAELSLASGQEQLIDAQLKDPSLCRMDPSFFSSSFQVQAISCMEKGKPGSEKRILVRSQSEPQGSYAGPDSNLLGHFGTQELTIAVSCRGADRGKTSALPNQDAFSMTKTHLDIALYVVCDGHGPFGHIAASRIVQSLPKFTFDLLQSHGPGAADRAENVLLSSFADANAELEHFAKERRIDMSSSGATCSALLRIGSDVIISWVGDCGAFLGSITERAQKVELVTEPHTTDVPKELNRVQEYGAKIRPIRGHNAKRIFRPGTDGPGTFSTRAFGDFSVADEYGLTVNPDFKKTSFQKNPGLVLLASGGLWEVMPNAESSLTLFARCGLQRGDCSEHQALSKLCDLAKQIWIKEDKGLSDDVTCILLHWDRPVAFAPPPPPPPPFPNQQAQDENLLQGLFDPPQVDSEFRSKPTLPKDKEWSDDHVGAVDHLGQPDPTLGHPAILAQVVSCMYEGEKFGEDKAVWFSEKGEPRAVRIPSSSKKEWLRKFQVANIEVAAVSQRGQRHPQSRNPNQDNFSITSASGNRAIYVVCDGHGTFGHLISFRIAQTLPIFVLEGLESRVPFQEAASHAFRKVARDLNFFAQENRLDFTESGTSCAAVFRDGDKVFIAWLGDSRILLATVGQGNRRLDFMSSPHLASSATECRRFFKAGYPVQAAPGEPARIYSGKTDGPGLTITRAFGDFCLQEAVICQPDVANSSFEGVPGLILLASGGMCEYFGQNAGEAMLQTLAVNGGLLDKGPDNALRFLCDTARRQWQTRQNTYCEDISGILIQWLGAGRTPATLAAVPGSSSPGRAKAALDKALLEGRITPIPLDGHGLSPQQISNRDYRPLSPERVTKELSPQQISNRRPLSPERATDPLTYEQISNRRLLSPERATDPQTHTSGSIIAAKTYMNVSVIAGNNPRQGLPLERNDETRRELSPDRITSPYITGNDYRPVSPDRIKRASEQTRTFLQARPQSSTPSYQTGTQALAPVQSLSASPVIVSGGLQDQYTSKEIGSQSSSYNPLPEARISTSTPNLAPRVNFLQAVPGKGRLTTVQEQE